MKKKKIKSTIKVPSILSIIYLLIIFIAVLTHFLDSEFIVKQYLADVISSPIKGIYQKVEPIIFIAVAGGFIGMLYNFKVIQYIAKSIQKKINGKERIFIPLLMLFFSIWGAIYGMDETIFLFFPILVPILLLLGFDSLTGCAIILLGIGSGILGSISNANLLVEIMNILPKNIALDNSKLDFYCTLIWAVSYFICTHFVTSYAIKIKKKKVKSYMSTEEIELSTQYFSEGILEDINYTKRIKGMIIVLFITLLILLLSIFPWLNLEFNFLNGMVRNIFGNAFAHWGFLERTCLISISCIIIAFLSGENENKNVKIFIKGISNTIDLILIIAFTQGLAIIIVESGLDKYIINNAVNSLVGANKYVMAVTSYIMYMGLSFLIPTTTHLSQKLIPAMLPLTSSPVILLLSFSTAAGLMQLITPLSSELFGSLQISKLSITTWLKFISKVILTLFIVIVLILHIAMRI